MAEPVQGSCFADHSFVLRIASYGDSMEPIIIVPDDWGETSMKIASIEAIHLRAEDPLIELFDGSYDDCVLVVHTDEGLTGIGETESMAPAIQAIVEGPSAHNHARSLSAVLIGQDPSDPV